MKYEIPDEEATGVAQEDVLPVPKGVGGPVTCLGDVANIWN